MGTSPFFGRYQNGLLEWIHWTKNPAAFYQSYIQMTSEEARRRFQSIVASGYAPAIQAAWTQSVPMPAQVLAKLQDTSYESKETQYFILLLLSEQGDENAYRKLKDGLLTAILPSQQPQPILMRLTLTDRLARVRLESLKELLRHPRPGYLRYWPASKKRIRFPGVAASRARSESFS